MATFNTSSTKSDSIVYKEPTYELRLTPESKSFTQKSTPYQNLDALVDHIMVERFGDSVQKFSKKELKRHRAEIAHSLMNRFDQKSELTIELPLAKTLELVSAIKRDLEQIAGRDKDLTPLAEFVFSSCENFERALPVNIDNVLGPNFPNRDALFNEICRWRKEIHKSTSATMKYYRPTQSTHGLSYLDHKGERVDLTHTIPSSYDRPNPHVQNGRLNLNHDGHVIYSAGRIETKEKAYEVLFPLIQQTFISGQSNRLKIQSDGSHLYPVAIENLISSPPIAKKEREYLLAEDAVLKSLTGEILDITLPSGKKIKVQLQLIHFSTQTNYNAFFGQQNGWTSTGADVGERITKEGTASLRDYYEEIKDSLLESSRNGLDLCFNELEKSSSPQDRFILRAFICEMLDIPYHIHCKSSKDRTAVVAAIKKGLHQWLKLKQLSGNCELPKPQELLKNSTFRELTEAAFFENLPMTDQGVGISGVLGGKLYTQDRGFNYQKSLFEHPLPAVALSDRYLHKASIVERILYTATMSVFSLALIPLYLAFTPVILGILYTKFKGDFWEAYKYLLLVLITFPLTSGSRKKWLDRDSKELKARNFLVKHHPKVKVAPLKTELHLTPKELNQAVDNLSAYQYERLASFLQTSDPSTIAVINGENKVVPDESLVYILKEIGNSWEKLKKAENSERLNKLLTDADKSRIALFTFQKMVTETYLERFIRDANERPSTADATAAIVKGENQFELDFHRQVIRIKTETQTVEFKSKSSSLLKFHQTLKTLPALKNQDNIPYAVLDFLTQKTTLFVAADKYLSTFSDQLSLSTPEKRLFTIQNNSPNSISVHLEEVFPILSINDPKNPIGRMHCGTHYTLRFTPDSGWTAVVEELDPVQIEWMNVAPLLSIHKGTDYPSVVREYNYDNTIMALKHYIQALAVFDENKTVIPVDDLIDNINYLKMNLKIIARKGRALEKARINTELAHMRTALDQCTNEQRKKIILKTIEEIESLNGAVTKI